MDLLIQNCEIFAHLLGVSSHGIEILADFMDCLNSINFIYIMLDYATKYKPTKSF